MLVPLIYNAHIFCTCLTSPKRTLLGCTPVHTKKKHKNIMEGGEIPGTHQEKNAQENLSPGFQR